MEYLKEHGIAYSTLKSRVKKDRGMLKKLFEVCCLLEMDQFGNEIGYKVKSTNNDCCD